VKLIVAVNNNGVIGDKGQIPWVCKEDLRHFARTTKKHVVIMGRNTFDSLGSKPLVNRYNIVLTSTSSECKNTKNAFYANDIEQCLEAAEQRWKKYPETKAFVIGGQFVYEEFLRRDLITEILLTQVWNYAEGDTFFEIPKGWSVQDQKELCDEATLYTYKKTVKTFKRKKKKK
jgi:dihydrofolate reductase